MMLSGIIDLWPQTHTTEKAPFTASAVVRDIVIGMSGRTDRALRSAAGPNGCVCTAQQIPPRSIVTAPR